MVNFAGLEFIFRFLPIFLILYYVIPKRFRETVLLLGSIVFYGVGEPFFILVLLTATGLNYWLGVFMLKDSRLFEVRPWQEQRKKRFLIAIVALDVGILAVFKGLSVFVSSALLPLGISFYIFKMISYQVDLYRGEIKEDVRFRDAALYFIMFPQVVSGPIMRYREGAFGSERSVGLAQVEDGLKYFIVGLGMKVLLADRLAILWNDLQMIGFASISTPLAWLGAAAFSLQLYFDFWGYSLMAAGLGVMLGFDFMLNFDHPYAAGSISEFYRRWHVSLGSWFRDYVYFPLGGSRGGGRKLAFNLLVVWLLTGLWHGNGFNFLIWGLVLGVLIASEKFVTGKFFRRHGWLGRLYVLFLIPLTWVVFAISDMTQLGLYFSRLFPFFGHSGVYVNQSDFVNYLSVYGGLMGAGIILCIPIVFRTYEKYKRNPLAVVLLLGVFWISIYFLVGSQSNPFIYFKF